MATLLPDTPKDCPFGERQVFERFERDFADQRDWIVLHSLGLAEHQHKLWGEIDFVVLSTKGVFVIEVKGGRVACDDRGNWIYSAPGGQSFTRKESPWTQASTAMFALRDRVCRDWPEFRGLLLGFGVVMPHETFTATGAEIEPAVLLDRRSFGSHLGTYLGSLQRHWEGVYRERHGAAPRTPTVADIRRLRSILRPEVESGFSLGSWLNSLDAELIQLTNGQIRAARRMAGNPRTVVRGRAGTGKTILAVERAKALAAQGLDVLYLCFNRLLARHVELALAGDGSGQRVRVRHIHALYREVIDRAGLADRLAVQVTDAELFGRVFPEVFFEAALTVDPGPVDVLIVDEAQDILTPENLDALDILVKDGLRNGHWHLFLDPMQDIYGRQSEAAQERLQSTAAFAWDDLYENCRNTRRVALQTSIMSGIDMAIEGAPDGVACDAVWCSSPADLHRRLDARVAELIRGGVDPARMIILSARRLENSVLAGKAGIAGLPLRELKDGPADGGLAFSTMHAFKGLERDVVLAVDLDGLGDATWSMLLYAGLSRARLLLVPFVPEHRRDAYLQLAEAFARRNAG